MGLKILPDGVVNRDQHHDCRDQCERDVREERDEIDYFRPTLDGESDGFWFREVISQVASKEQGRRNERGGHAENVLFPHPPLDENESSDDENGADCIEGGINGRELVNRHKCGREGEIIWWKIYARDGLPDDFSTQRKNAGISFRSFRLGDLPELHIDLRK